MNRKQLVIVLVLLALAGGASLWKYRGNRQAWHQPQAAAGGKVLGEFSLNDVTRLTLRSAAGQVTLEQKGDSWCVVERGDYPASFEQVAGFIQKLWDLKATQLVKVSESQLGRLELVAPDAKPAAGQATGLVVELAGKDGKPIRTLLLGKTHRRDVPGMPGEGIATGRYVMPLDGSKTVSLVTETFSDAAVQPERWIDRSFLSIERIQSIALSGTTPAMQWKIQRASESAPWELADAKPDEKVDATKAPLLSAPSLNDVLLPDATPESVGLDQPAVITVETFDHFTYVLKVGREKDGNLPLTVEVRASLPTARQPGADEKPEDKERLDKEFAETNKRLTEKLASEKKFEGRIYLVAKYGLESALKERQALLAAPSPTPSPSPAPTASPAPSPHRAEATTAPVTAPTPKPRKSGKR